LDQALAAKQDLWGLAAMQQPNGPSYEFFEKLLPPLRYVNATFRHYPIVLSAPGSMQKVRLVSNGSAVNARAALKTWRDTGIPVTFRLGQDHEMFGENLEKLCGPKLDKGYLPIVRLTYSHKGSVCQEEAFASAEPELAAHGVAFVRFLVTSKEPEEISAHVDVESPLTVVHGALHDTNGQIIVSFSENWKWRDENKALVANLSQNQAATLAIPTKPIPSSSKMVLAAAYKKQRQECAHVWQSLLDRGAQFETPEPLVNNAWRGLTVGCFTMLKSNLMNYSHGNSYERLYEAECGDAARALALFGHTDDVGTMVPPLMIYRQEGLKFHNAGFKLQLLSHYYWLTRDSNFINSIRPKWSDEIKLIVKGREKDSGLLPREHYCGDIHTQVYSLHSNGACWRGLRDFAAVLAELGETGEAKRLTKIAEEYRQAIFAATEKSEYTNVSPQFIPVALFGEEKPYDHLTSSMLGSYWDLIAPYMLGSGMFGPGSARERAIVDYLQEHGGICMGMIRFDQHSGLFANENGLDDLYGLRYTTKLLQLDEVDRALVSFYGKLAQGLTRDTFIGGEGSSLRPLDESGRPMYLPPSSSGNALFLWTLRYLLVQDWDMDDDGTPETLRLCFATPKPWLEDRKSIKVLCGPTAFGPVSSNIESKLSSNKVIAKLDLPTRNPAKRTFLRIRVPDGWQVLSAKAGKKQLKVAERGTTDISSLRGKVEIQFDVKRL